MFEDTDNIARLPSPTWKEPSRSRRPASHTETVELLRLDMERAIWAYRQCVGPRAVRTELNRILEKAA